MKMKFSLICTRISLLLLLLLAGITNGNAQSKHVACAPFCELAATDTYYKVSCIDAVCKVCYEKQQKERKKRQEEEKKALANHAKLEEQRREERIRALEKQKQQIAAYRKKQKENELVLVAPTPKVNQAESGKVAVKTTPPTKGSKPELTYFWDRNLQRGGFKQSLADPDNGVYYGYSDWVIQPVFLTSDILKGLYYYDFPEDADYTFAAVARGETRQTSCSRIESVTHYDFALINRKGETILRSGMGNGFEFLGRTPFMIKYYDRFKIYAGCYAEVIEVPSGKKILDLTANTFSDYGTYFERAGISVRSNGQLPTNTPSQFTNKVNEIFLKEGFDVMVHVWNNTRNKSKGAKGYFFGKNGKYKVIEEAWLAEIEKK